MTRLGTLTPSWLVTGTWPIMSTRLIQIFSGNHPHQIKSPSVTPEKTPMEFGPHYSAGNKIFASSFYSSVLPTASASTLCILGAIHWTWIPLHACSSVLMNMHFLWGIPWWYLRPLPPEDLPWITWDSHQALLCSSIGTHVIPHHRHHVTIFSTYCTWHPLIHFCRGSHGTAAGHCRHPSPPWQVQILGDLRL